MPQPDQPAKVRMLMDVGGYTVGTVLTVDQPDGEFMGQPHIPVPADKVDAYIAAGYVERVVS